MCIFMIHCSIIIINYMFTFLLLNSNVLHSYIFCTFLGLLYNVFTFRFTYAGWMGDVSGRWLVIFVPTNVNYLFFNDKIGLSSTPLNIQIYLYLPRRFMWIGLDMYTMLIKHRLCQLFNRWVECTLWRLNKTNSFLFYIASTTNLSAKGLSQKWVGFLCWVTLVLQ